MIYHVIKWVTEICGVYLLWIIIHYISGILYNKICTPNTIYGFLMSPFLITTPQCQALRWTIYNGGNIINNMWIVFGTWIASKMITNITKNT